MAGIGACLTPQIPMDKREKTKLREAILALLRPYDGYIIDTRISDLADSIFNLVIDQVEPLEEEIQDLGKEVRDLRRELEDLEKKHE